MKSGRPIQAFGGGSAELKMTPLLGRYTRSCFLIAKRPLLVALMYPLFIVRPLRP